jgi:hypothetical protein
MTILSYDQIQTPKLVWEKLLELNPIDKNAVFFEPFSGENSLYDQVDCVVKNWCEITKGKDIFFFEFKDEIEVIYTNPPYLCSIPNKKGIFKERNAVYFFMEYFMTNYRNLKKIGFIMNQKCFSSFTPKRLKKLNDLGFTISTMTLFNCNFWFGLHYFVVFDKEPNSCYKYIEQTFLKTIC